MPEPIADRNGSEPAGNGASVDDASAAFDDSFAQLRSIIVGPERRELLALQERVLDPTAQTRDVSRVLPDAMELRAHDPQLMRALAPSVESAITASVRRDPQPLADALFPVIGPAIRKAVAHTLAAMMESINQAIDRSLSWQALRWRWIAWRTGKPFAEIVLLNTIEYRVEQIFLVHRETGLLLQHVAVDAATGQDADQISAMLTAIRDFARDSFNVSGNDSLESIRVGDLAVSVEQGPRAILAAVVRGTIPASVRASCQEALESVHRQFGPELLGFAGDAAPFARTRPMLEACLVSQQRAPARRASYRRWALAAMFVAAAGSVWLFFEMRARQRWSAYLERRGAEAGIVVLASGRRAGTFFVSGLRDPLAVDPATLIAGANLSSDAIRGRWEPYQAIYPPFVTARAELLLRPPAGIALAFDNGVLKATGSAPERWLADAERLAPAIVGVRQFAFAGESTERRLIGQIETAHIGFAKGMSTLEPAQHAAIAALVTTLEELNRVLAASDRRARLEITGHADSDGPDALNDELSQARARTVVAALPAEALDRFVVSTRGLGKAPLVAGATEIDHERNRRVAFRVEIEGGAFSRSDHR
jgi:OOP family OmpA-OmpF porin